MTDRFWGGELHYLKRIWAGLTACFVVQGKLQAEASRPLLPEGFRRVCQTSSASPPCFTTALLSAEGYELLSRYTFQYSTLADLYRHFNGLLRHGRDPEACFPTADCYAEAICLDL